MQTINKSCEVYRGLHRDTRVKLLFIFTWFILDGVLALLFHAVLPTSGGLFYAVLLLLLAGVIIYDQEQGVGLLFSSLAMSGLMVMPVALFCLIAPATPALPIDATLARVDHMMGYHADVVVNWANTHRLLTHVLNLSYGAILYELYFFIIVLAFLGDSSAIQKFLMSMALCYSCALVFYVWFPSLAPAYSYADMPMNTDQRQVIDQFLLLHLGIPLYFHDMAIIAFPSFHTIWAVSLTFYAKHRVRLCAVLGIINASVVLSTLTTGSHYLVDVLGGATLACIAFAVTAWISRRDKVSAPSPVWLLQPPRRQIKFEWISLCVFMLTVVLNSPLVMLMAAFLLLAHVVMWTNKFSRVIQ